MENSCEGVLLLMKFNFLFFRAYLTHQAMQHILSQNTSLFVYKLTLKLEQIFYCSNSFSFCVTNERKYTKANFKVSFLKSPCFTNFGRFRIKKNELHTINLRWLTLALYLFHFSDIGLKIQDCIQKKTWVLYIFRLA